jgi:hypothetical protein
MFLNKKVRLRGLTFLFAGFPEGIAASGRKGC